MKTKTDSVAWCRKGPGLTATVNGRVLEVAAYKRGERHTGLWSVVVDGELVTKAHGLKEAKATALHAIGVEAPVSDKHKSQEIRDMWSKPSVWLARKASELSASAPLEKDGTMKMTSFSDMDENGKWEPKRLSDPHASVECHENAAGAFVFVWWARHVNDKEFTKTGVTTDLVSAKAEVLKFRSAPHYVCSRCKREVPKAGLCHICEQVKAQLELEVRDFTLEPMSEAERHEEAQAAALWLRRENFFKRVKRSGEDLAREVK